MTEADLQAIKEIFSHQLGIYAEDVQHKLDLVVEGQQMLVERLDRFEVEVREEVVRVDRRIGVVHAELGQHICNLERKLDGVAADLSAHRRDTESHAV